MGVDLRYADLRYADLKGANLTDANLRYADLKGANLRYADLKGANLMGVDLRYAVLMGAYLTNADLTDANLRYAVGNNVEIKTLQLGTYITTITKHSISIGCQQHALEEWLSFSDDKISRMDTNALEWCNRWKDVIIKVAKSFE